ncbi:MAG: hypothetical protein WAU17_00065 [Nitrospirales bacterium]
MAISNRLSQVQRHPPSQQFLRGGETVAQPDIEFGLFEGQSWSLLPRSTYEGIFEVSQVSKNHTVMVGVRVYNAPSSTNKQNFFEAVKKVRVAEPQTGRFESRRNRDALSDARSETCVVH